MSVLTIFQKLTGGSSVGFGSGADLNEEAQDPVRSMVHAVPNIFTQTTFENLFCMAHNASYT
jgi:hypothetical protein